MVEIIFGTTNQAKLLQVRGALAPSGIDVRGVENQGFLPEILEDGKTAIENAIKKAKTYSDYLNKPVIAMDNALFLNGLSPEKQPGLNVRRIPGFLSKPTDEEMIDYYSKLIGSLGDRIGGYWEYGVCIAAPNGKISQTVITTPRIFVNIPSSKIEPGYPLESLQIDPLSNKYVSELSPQETDDFWQRTIGVELKKFVTDSFKIL